MSYTEAIITITIVVIVLFVARRSGQANPIGTGRLARRITDLELTVGQQGARMEAIETSIVRVADSSAESAKSIQAMRIELASDRGLTERTWAAVDRLQQFFIEESFERRRER